MNKQTLHDTIKTLKIKVRHLENQHEVDMQQYEKTTEEYFDILNEISMINDNLQREIIERKKAEEALHHKVIELNSFINNIPDMAWLKDINSNYIVANKAFCDAVGIKSEYLINNKCEICFGKEKAEKIKSDDQKVIESRKQIIIEESITNSKGEKVYLETLNSPMFDDSGEIIGTVGIAREITERKQLEEERIKASKLESIGILAGGIAHDFNNILTVILGNISMIKLGKDENSEENELLLEVEKASYQAKELTRQLLTFSKGGSPKKESTNLINLIKYSTRFSLRGSNVIYRFSIAKDLWTVDVDKGQINQVLNNLIINAKQAMTVGGTIKITGNNVHITRRDNLPLEKGRYIKVSIIDQGTGISDELLSKIFDPYFTSKKKGSGLGLTTAYSIINKHNGFISVESEVGVGTAFHIYLPASSKQVKKSKPVKSESIAYRGKILLMDDEPKIRTVVAKMLTTLGNKVTVASDGAEAIELYKKAFNSNKPYDMIILDLTVPGGVGGKKAINKILKIDPDAKAIVSSGYSNDHVVSNFQEYGFKGNICKPFKLESLKNTINTIMRAENV